MIAAKTPWPSEGVKDIDYEQPCPRQKVTFACERGHSFDVRFAAGADVPASWTCRCGSPAGDREAPAAESELERRMAQILQRRTRAELEDLLAERLAAIRRR